MTSHDIRKKFLKFFAEKNHAILPSASLVPENDPTVLFTTAGMHPLIPFLLGELHPSGQRLANCQKCIRTVDIDEVGDRWHLTFFEMLGNWSLGDYFKKEAIEYSWEFLTSNKWLGLDKNRLYITIFKGDNNIPIDEESKQIWLNVGVQEEKIYYFGKDNNWWGPPGKTGPCGPDTEIYYDIGLPNCGPDCKPGCDCGKYLEIWNNVFIQYNKTAENEYKLLKQKNIDTGMGLERIAAVMQHVGEVYETDLFKPIMLKLDELASIEHDTAKEIIADHIKAAVFIISDGISPSNLDQGYVLRRLIRRAIRYGKQLGIKQYFCADVADVVISIYKENYPELLHNKSEIVMELVNEEDKFSKTIDQGLKKFQEYRKNTKYVSEEKHCFSGIAAFDLYQSYGFPLEMTLEEAKKEGLTINKDQFLSELNKHQKLSKNKSVGKFSGGLADASEQSKKYHTATHLLHQSLRTILGDHVKQKGSNITSERLRFDFSHPEKMTNEQINEVENLVNEKIKSKLPISCEEMDLEIAQKHGAIGLFANKYGKKVKVYSIANFSCEICGGPHVNNTGELGLFKIIKEESASSGIRRIKAILT